MLVGGAAFFASFSVGFIDPTWSKHLKYVLGFSSAGAGGMFMLPVLFYVVGSGAAGGLSDAVGPKPVMVGGFGMLALAWLFIGPAPFISTALGK